MKKQDWIDAWRLVRSESPWIGQWTPEPVLMAHEALIARRTWEGEPSPLAYRLASFKAKKHNVDPDSRDLIHAECLPQLDITKYFLPYA